MALSCRAGIKLILEDIKEGKERIKDKEISPEDLIKEIDARIKLLVFGLEG